MVPCEMTYMSHELYGAPTCDGILVTKSVVKEKKAKAIVEAGGIAKFLRLPDGMPVMGDCGAFQFINDEIPPYTCQKSAITTKAVGLITE